MDAKITIVVDNNTSQGPALENNAQALGVDVATTDILVLSHGHYDHTGGIAHVLGRPTHIDVYCHPGVVRPRYAVRDGKARSIGMPRKASEALAQLPSDRLHLLQEPLMLTEAIGVTGPIPRLTGYDDTGGPFFLGPEPTHPDLIEDHLALWVQTDQGLVVCMGCAHAGLVNTLNHIRELTDGAKIRAVIGGFHLLSAGHERLTQSIMALRALAPDMVVPCHCTGESAVASLCQALGERVSVGASGMTYQF